MADQNEENAAAPSQGGLAANRTRRARKDGARKAMLAKIKEAKSTGQRVKYEMKEVEDVYDEVDEYEYSKRVNDRLDDDWIVDDGTGDYYEDGREVFDEDGEDCKMETIDAESASNKKSKSSSKRKVKMTKSKNIKNMLAGMGTKRKASEKNVALGNDELLGDILSEMSQAPESSSLSTPPPSFLLKKKKANAPAMQPVQKAIRRPRIDKPPPVNDFLAEQRTQQVTPPAKRPKPDLQLNPNLQKEFECELEEDIPEQMVDCDDDENFPEVEARVEEKSQKKKIEVKQQPAVSPASKSSVPHLNWDHNTEEPLIPNTDVVLSSNELPLVENKNGEKFLRFYWLDAHEDPYNHPDSCYLFGKVYVKLAKAHVSCCLTIKNLQRTIYLLPRDKHREKDEEVTMKDLYEEFNETVASKYGIMKFKTKVVEKKNVFGDQNIPECSEYLEIRYPASYPAVPQDLSGATFSQVFGSQRKPIETVLIEKNINGPCWLDIKLPQLNTSHVSWCKVEAFVSSMVNISITTDPPEMPPLTVLTLTTKTLPNLKTHQNELLALSCLIHYNYQIDKPAPKPLFQKHFCAISKPSDCVYPYDLRDVIKKRNLEVEVTGSERALLTYFLAKIQKIDPDVIIGHGVVDFDLDVLLHRISACKVLHWSRIGRLKRLHMPKFNSHGHTMDRAITCGRVLCDVKIMAKELIRCKSYDLNTLADVVLHKPRQQLPMEQYKNMFNSSNSLMWLIEHTCIDANASLSIASELNVLPLALQITTIAGNVLSRTLLGGRAERNEFLLLHAFHQRGFLVPEKIYKKKEPPKTNNPNETTTTSRRAKKAAYAGGLVLEPKKGFYDKFILLLDFNSLYPSIIQEYNICFTTIDRYPKDDKVDGETFIPDIPEAGMEAGVLPTEIRKLVDRRRQVKNLMKGSNVSPDQMTQYDIRQKALKLTANSMYGCLGFANSRFYAKPLAALVTMMGREILMQTKELAERMNLEVIYGDTDSIMINTNSCDIEQVFKIGQQVKTEVNKLYKLLEIDIDGVYKSMLLLKKKKYAALSVSKNPDGSLKTTQEMKGLDIVRRDWSELAKLAGSYSVSQILSDQPRETIVDNIHTKLTEMADKVRRNDFPLSVYEINKELTRDPSEYRQKISLPHVLVASRLNEKMLKHLKAGDIVSYIVCDDGTSNPATQRGYTISEIEANGELKVDVQYYLSQQVHPVVMRLCDPIDGTDSAQIAQCLGLDPTSYRSSRSNEEDDADAFLLLQTNEQERFADCEPLILNLPNDEKITLKTGVFAETEPSWKATLQQTMNDGKTLATMLPRIQNQVTMEIRNHINKYYQNWLVCDDNLCGHRTRRVPVAEDHRDIVCSVCQRGTLRPEYSFKSLYNQLCFYKLQFDVDYALKKYKQNTVHSPGNMSVHQVRHGYDVLLNSVNKYLNASAYNQVSLSELFGRL